MIKLKINFDLFDYVYLYESKKYDNTCNKDPIPQWLVKSKELMKRDENLNVGLKKFLKLSGKSQEYTTIQMKKYYNQTPTEFINKLRLERAKKLLISTDMPILKIMYETGFNNEAYFYLLFKKEYTISPKIYREQNRKIVFRIDQP